MAKYEELIDDFELEKRIRTIPEDMDLSEYIKQRGGVDYPEEEKADGGAIGIEVLFEEKMKDGGRAGFFMGGPALEGQALAIYNSMNVTGATDQEIADRLQSLGLYTPGGTTPPAPGDNIIGSQINQGGGGGGITELLKTYTTEKVSPTGGVMTQDLLTLDEKKGNPAFMVTVPNPEDFPYAGPVQQFSKIGENLFDVNPEGTIKGQRTYRTPRTISDQVYAASQAGELGSISQEDLYKPSFFDKTKQTFGSLKDKFFQPKVKGTLGDRAQKQFELGQKLPSFFSKIVGMQSPFNPESRNYNPLMAGQLNFLEASPMVTRKSGQFINPKLGAVEGNFMDVTGSLIGRDPNTGALKYGPGSVLSGKNVISGFGTNDYETALMDYITKMNANKRISAAGKAAKLAAAQAELEAERERQRQEGQRTTNQGTLDYGITQGISERDYRSIDRTRERSDRQDEGKGPGGSTFDYSDPYDPGGGEKDGGFIDGYNRRKYSDGGLATMFTRRR